MVNNNRWGSMMPTVTKHLIIINAIMWVATILLGSQNIVDLTELLGLHFWQGSDFHSYQFLTYMFMHDAGDPATQGVFTAMATSIYHIFFNMFSLWMFGMLLERVMGAKRYLIFYIVCGLGAGLVQELVWQFSWESILAGINHVETQVITNAIANGEVTSELVNQFHNNLITVGASGAVFGILLAFAMLFPNMPLYIMFIPIPIKAKWAVIGYGVLELFFGVTGTADHVAHFAHLGGMLFAFIILLYWKKKGIFRFNGSY